MRAYYCFGYQDQNRVDLADRMISMYQVALLKDDVMEKAKTELTKLGDSEWEDYEKFKLFHEDEKQIWGKAFDIEFKSILEFSEYYLYAHKTKPRAIIWGKGADVRKAIKRLKQNEENEVPILHMAFDLNELLRAMKENVSGGWFSGIRITGINSAALFGDQVSQSDEWERLITQGDLSLLTIDFQYGNMVVKMNITSDGGVIFFQNLNESDYLKVLDSLLDHIENVVRMQ